MGHIRRRPDPSRDINPPAASSRRVPASLGYDSDDEGPFSVRKRPAKQFPPIPDLRFEQSYLQSISKAETWWQVAFITVKDQVGQRPALHRGRYRLLMHLLGRVPPATGVFVEHHTLRMAGMEPECEGTWQYRRGEG